MIVKQFRTSQLVDGLYTEYLWFITIHNEMPFMTLSMFALKFSDQPPTFHDLEIPALSVCSMAFPADPWRLPGARPAGTAALPHRAADDQRAPHFAPRIAGGGWDAISGWETSVARLLKRIETTCKLVARSFGTIF